MSHPRIALVTMAASFGLVLLDGWLFARAEHIAWGHGVYCIWMTAITVGGDVTPSGYGYWCLALAPFPLVAAAFSFLTSGLAAVHVRAAKDEIKLHVSEHLGL